MHDPAAIPRITRDLRRNLKESDHPYEEALNSIDAIAYCATGTGDLTLLQRRWIRVIARIVRTARGVR